jgi:hypothetical protein
MGAQGTATLDFGSSPTSEGSVAVTGQSGIVAGSHAEAFLMREDATEQYDMGPVLLRFACGSVIAGTGFTIYAHSLFPATGPISVRWVWN